MLIFAACSNATQSDPALISGTVEWTQFDRINPSAIEITLPEGEKFKTQLSGQNLSSWFPNLPRGCTAVLKNLLRQNAVKAVFTISGTALDLGTTPLAVAIPGAALVSGTPLAVDPEVTFNVTPSVPPAGAIAIGSAAELAKIGNAYPLNGYYYLTADIDLAAINPWIPIGSIYDIMDSKWGLLHFVSPFTGTLDGQGHTIRNPKLGLQNTIKVSGNQGSTSHSRSLIFQNDGTVKNLTIDMGDFTTAVSGGSRVGTDLSPLAGKSSGGRIVGVTAKGKITASFTAGYADNGFTAGAFTGTGDPEIIGCVSELEFNISIGSGQCYVGGIAGQASSISFCEVKNPLTVTINDAYNLSGDYTRIGGITGRAAAAALSQNTVSAPITVTASSINTLYAGSIAGESLSGKITGSSASGSLTVSASGISSVYAGKLVGSRGSAAISADTVFTGTATLNGAGMP
jgi:hypothetical protein